MCMFKKSLKGLDKQELSIILKEFGEERRIFQSEAQFQFELAWKLKELIDCDVKLEDLTVLIKENEVDKKKRKCKKEIEKIKQKQYTDIVLEKDDYRVAIELKYKTAKMESGEILLLDHGAVDTGRYDYLWDVNRLELLIRKTVKIPIERAIYREMGKKLFFDAYKIRKSYNKGFAIMLTNEQKYWNDNWVRPTTGITITNDNQFKIGQNKSHLYDSILDWPHDISKQKYPEYYPKTVMDKGKPTFRARPIVLLQPYHYQWGDYYTIEGKENGQFKFLIISVDENSQFDKSIVKF